MFILFMLQFSFLPISSLNEQQQFVIKKCLPKENFIKIAYILNNEPESDQKMSDLTINLGENTTIFQFKRFKSFMLF